MPTSNLNKIEARMQQKHDFAENWKNSNFIPEAGEYIIYDPDEHTQFPRMKIGDGKNKVPNLPFVSEIYVQPDEPADAEDGAIWINPDDQATGNDVAADWDSTKGQPGYVDNRPLWSETVKITWDGSSFDRTHILLDTEVYQLNEWINLYAFGGNLVGNTMTIVNTENQAQELKIAAYCSTLFELQNWAQSAPCLVAISGMVLGYPASFTVIAYLLKEQGVIPILLFTPNDDVLETGSKKGIYAFNFGYYVKQFSFNNIYIGDKYSGYFDSLYNPIHVLSVDSEEDLNINFSLFKPGSVLLVVSQLNQEE